MKKCAYFPLAILFCLLLFSCNIDGNGEESSEFSFLKPGHSWTYKMTIDGKPAPADVSYTVGSADGDGYYNILYVTTNLSQKEYDWYADENFFADETGADADTDYLFPLIFSTDNKTGRKWVSPVTDEDLGLLYRKIIGVSVVVAVEAGTFTDCLAIEESCAADAAIINRYYVSVQYGIVKKEITAWADVENHPRIYYPIKFELRSKNF